VTVVHDTALAIDAERRHVRLAGGRVLAYDRLVVSPGIELQFDRVRGMSEAAAEEIPHAWKAGPQTALLRRQLEAMTDGGVVLIGVPAAPYRCPPGPYERACQIAGYLKGKPRSKLIVLDANAAVTPRPLFTRVWKEDYAGIVSTDRTPRSPRSTSRAVPSCWTWASVCTATCSTSFRRCAPGADRADCGTRHCERPLVRYRLGRRWSR
jgi:hypothetical protein